MRIRRFMLATLVALTLAGCKDDDDPTGVASVAGTYQLRTINGAPLPFLVEDGAERFEITSGVIILRDNMTFTDSTTFRLTSGTTTHTGEEVATGTFTRNNNAVSFTAQDGFQYSANLSGSTLTQTVETFVFEYRK